MNAKEEMLPGNTVADSYYPVIYNLHVCLADADVYFLWCNNVIVVEVPATHFVLRRPSHTSQNLKTASYANINFCVMSCLIVIHPRSYQGHECI